LRGTSAYLRTEAGGNSHPGLFHVYDRSGLHLVHRHGATALDDEPPGLVDQTGVSDRFSTRYRWAIRNEPAA